MVINILFIINRLNMARGLLLDKYLRRRGLMKRILELFEEMMVAVAFAEEGVNLFEIERTNCRVQSMHIEAREIL